MFLVSPETNQDRRVTEYVKTVYHLWLYMKNKHVNLERMMGSFMLIFLKRFR